METKTQSFDLSEVGYTIEGWEDFFYREDVVKELKEISLFLKDREFYPEKGNIFSAFINPDDIKVVILGQDPYHDGAAVGIAFSVKDGRNINPSLRNIGKEVVKNGFTTSGKGNLFCWLQQGVFLLNTALTVEPGKPESHCNIWKKFTFMVIEYLASRNNHDRVSSHDTPVGRIWLLWGNKARIFASIVRKNRSNFVLETSHPSPLSYDRGFKGTQHFKIANEWLESKGYKGIDWSF